MWQTFPDDKGDLYYVFFPIYWTRNVSDTGDTSAFLKTSIGIAPHTTVFEKDLTNIHGVDEAFIAILSLLLLITIDAIIATILLRTNGGNVSLFGFSVNKFVELTRSFRFQHMKQKRDRRLGLKLFTAAFAVLLFSFVFGVTILSLTSRVTRDVTNATKTFELIQPVNPDWNAVRNDSLTSINQPCTVMSLRGAYQGFTTINTCMISNLSPTDFESFETTDAIVNVTIVSDTHKYGAEHKITIGDDTAKFSARAYVSFDDGQLRILKQRTVLHNRARDVRQVHKQYIGYLFSAYERATKDPNMNLERLSSLDFDDFTVENGPPISITQVGNGTALARTDSTRHTTKIRGIVPQGKAALRFGQSLFKAATAISVTEADEDDLFINDGESTAEVIVWRDYARHLNWLSLLIMLVCAFGVLMLLRFALKPIAMQDVASVMVRRAADEEEEREAFRTKRDPIATRYIRVSSLSDEREYRYGAETREDATLISEEYQEKAGFSGDVPYM